MAVRLDNRHGTRRYCVRPRCTVHARSGPSAWLIMMQHCGKASVEEAASGFAVADAPSSREPDSPGWCAEHTLRGRTTLGAPKRQTPTRGGSHDPLATALVDLRASSSPRMLGSERRGICRANHAETVTRTTSRARNEHRQIPRASDAGRFPERATRADSPSEQRGQIPRASDAGRFPERATRQKRASRATPRTG
jgi:hypothetical protein